MSSMTQSQMFKAYVPEFWLKEIQLAGFIVARTDYISFRGAIRVVDISTDNYIVLGWDKVQDKWTVSETTDLGITTQTYRTVEKAMEHVNRWVKQYGSR